MKQFLHNAVIFSVLAVSACAPHERPPAATPPAPAPAAQPAPPPQLETTTPRLEAISVWVDPAIMAACGISPQQAFFDFDSDAQAPGRRRTMNDIASCLSSGPLKGRMLRLVGHSKNRELNDPGKGSSKARTESIADYLTNMGMDRSKIRRGSPDDETSLGIDWRGWSYEQRVDIRLVE